MKRYWYLSYFAVWDDLPKRDIIWFEIGKQWADAMIGGNWFERQARQWVLGMVNPLFAQGMDLVLASYRGRLRPHIGPHGIWVAIKLPPLVRAAARKRDSGNLNTKEDMSHPPDPWVPHTWNVW